MFVYLKIVSRIIYMTVQIDDTLWGIPVGGVWLGFYRPETDELVTEEVDVKYFRGDAFETKAYLDVCVQKMKTGVFRDLGMRSGEKIEICNGYVLSSIREWFRDHGFPFEKAKITGRLQREMEKISREYIEGLPEFKHAPSGSLYNELIAWIQEKPKARLKYAKTGWKPIKKIMMQME